MTTVGKNACEHAAQVQDVTPAAAGCVACLESGQSWHHLRLCLTCGYVGCCDASPGRHATRHFQETAHPMIKSYEPGEDWSWCYVHGAYTQQTEPNTGKYRPTAAPSSTPPPPPTKAS